MSPLELSVPMYDEMHIAASDASTRRGRMRNSRLENGSRNCFSIFPSRENIFKESPTREVSLSVVDRECK